MGLEQRIHPADVDEGRRSQIDHHRGSVGGIDEKFVQADGQQGGGAPV
jgi:hypothetical protein